MKVTKISNVNLVENHFQAGNLRVIHMKTIHEDQKDFKCDSCGLTHRDKSLLTHEPPPGLIRIY